MRVMVMVLLFFLSLHFLHFNFIFPGRYSSYLLICMLLIDSVYSYINPEKKKWKKIMFNVFSQVFFPAWKVH